MRDMDCTTPVVVLGFHHGSLGIVRSLGRWRVPVYGVDADRNAPGLVSRYCRGAFVWDFLEKPQGQSVDFLLRCGRSIGRPALLIPTSDDSALFVAEHADSLRESYLFPVQSPELIRSLSNKRELYFLARKLGIPTPEAEFPESDDDISEVIRRAEFPLVLRGIDGNAIQPADGKRIVIVQSGAELHERNAALTPHDRSNVMLQEYIPGGDDTIWMFNGYFNQRSDHPHGCVL